MVHFNRTVAFSSWLSTFCTSVCIIMNCIYTNMSKTNIMVFQQFVHLSQVGLLHLISLQYWFLSPIFHLYWTRWCRSIHFSLIFTPKANADEGGNVQSVCLYHQRNQFYPHGWWRDSDITFCQSPAQDKCGHISSIPHRIKPKIIAFRPCQITLNRTLVRKFKKRCEFSSHFTDKSCKKKLCKKRPACLWTEKTKLWNK